MTGVIKTFLRFCAVISAPLVLGSCAEDIEVEKPQKGEQVNISISVQQDWDDDEATRASRMEKSDFAGPREAVQFDGTIGGQPVYIWCDELDGIDDGLSPLTAEAPELDDETRGTLMTATGAGVASDNMTKFHRDFSIWNYYGSMLIPDNTKAERLGSSNRWRLNNDFYDYIWWYGDQLCAIAPYGAPYTPADDRRLGFKYETPEKAVDQPDLMACVIKAYATDAEIVFPFRHVLSAIRFKMGPRGFVGGYTIKNIALQGVMTEGQLQMSTFYWLALANTRNITPNQDFNFPITDATYNTMITNDGDATTTGTTFLLIPQSTAFTCAIKLQDAGGQEKTITAAIPAKRWQPGYTYTYTIATEVDNSTFTLAVNGNPVFNYEGTYQSGGASGATNQYGIQSYRRTSANVAKPVAWEIVKYEYSDDNGTTWTETGNGGKDKPAWLTGLSLESGAGGTGWQYGQVTGIDSQSYIEDKNAERNAKFKTTPVTDYDLSTHDIKGNVTPMNTANCYVISAPGSYKIPLVYGNAIKNGAPNPSAYNYNNMLGLAWNTVHEGSSGRSWSVKYTKSRYEYVECLEHSRQVSRTTTGGDWYYTRTGTLFDRYDFVYVNPFVDYSGAAISDPWLKVNGANGTPSTAAVQWTSGSSHIPTNLNISGDYLTFDVPAANLRAGNSQVVVKDGSGKIMWSWHLWFAPDDVLDATEVTNYDGVKYNFAKETLGFTPGDWVQTTYNSPRKIRVTVQQKEGISGGSPQTGQFIITQNNGAMVGQGHAPVYQWGKKDPYLSSGIVGTASTTGSSPSIQQTILNPHYFYSNYSNLADVTYDQYYTDSKKKCEMDGSFGPSADIPTHTYRTHVSTTNQACPYVRRYDSYKGYYFTNLWNANTNNLNIVHDDPVVKTVYDPCPAGFHIPPSNAHSGFSLSGYTNLGEYAYVYSVSGAGLNGQSVGSNTNLWQLYSYGYRDATEAERKNSRVLTYFISNAFYGGNYLVNSNAPMAFVDYANSGNYFQNYGQVRVDNPIVSSTSGTYYMRLNTGGTWSFNVVRSDLYRDANYVGGHVVPVKD